LRKKTTGDLRRMSVSFRRPTNRKGNNSTKTHAVAKKLPAGWSHGNTSQAVFYSVGNIWCKMQIMKQFFRRLYGRLQ
jgi:hypothetical protein